MCEYDPACSKVTDPAAKALSEKPREEDAALLVICPRRGCLLAIAYELPGRDLVLCTPHMKLHLPDGNGDVHFHPALIDVSEYEPDEMEYGRCHCGTWIYRPAAIPEHIEAWSPEHAEWLKSLGVDPPGRPTLVNVRHPDGQVTRMGRRYVEKYGQAEGLEIMGTAHPHRRDRPFMGASYVRIGDPSGESDDR